MVDPLRAVSEVQAGGDTPGRPGLPAREVDIDAQRQEARWRSVTATAVAIAVAVGVALAGCAAVMTIRRRLRRGHEATPSSTDGEVIVGDDDLAERYFAAPKPPLSR